MNLARRLKLTLCLVMIRSPRENELPVRCFEVGRPRWQDNPCHDLEGRVPAHPTPLAGRGGKRTSSSLVPAKPTFGTNAMSRPGRSCYLEPNTAFGTGSPFAEEGFAGWHTEGFQTRGQFGLHVSFRQHALGFYTSDFALLRSHFLRSHFLKTSSPRDSSHDPSDDIFPPAKS